MDIKFEYGKQCRVQIKLRRNAQYQPKPEHEWVDGQWFVVEHGWVFSVEDTVLCAGEVALLPTVDQACGCKLLPTWFSSGDVIQMADA